MARGVAPSSDSQAIPNALATPGCTILPPTMLIPGARQWSSAQARRHPFPASWSAYGSVAFVRARVEVRGTAPGMFATP